MKCCGTSDYLICAREEQELVLIHANIFNSMICTIFKKERYRILPLTVHAHIVYFHSQYMPISYISTNSTCPYRILPLTVQPSTYM